MRKTNVTAYPAPAVGLVIVPPISTHDKKPAPAIGFKKAIAGLFIYPGVFSAPANGFIKPATIHPPHL